MHICHVNLAKGFSGGERQTLNLIKSLSLRKLKQTMVLRADSPLNQHLVGFDVEIIHVNHHLLGHWLGSTLPRDALLHAHDGKAVYWCALQNALYGNRYIITRRVDNPLKNKRLTRRGYAKATKVVCLSNAIATQVAKLSAEIPTQIIPSSYSKFAADPIKVAAIKQQFAGKTIIGQVGKLIHHKGYQLTIEVARNLELSHQQLQFLLFGSGADEQALQQQASGLSNVTFMGHQDEIGHYLAAMEVMLFPSLNEGLGSTILEAWQHQTPVIGSDAGGIPDMIEHQKTGILVAAGDVIALQQGLLQLLQSPQLSKDIVQRATQKLTQFTPESVEQRYYQLYQTLS
ncbi:glycosyltransferase family 4 protein [Ferrimonas lipolytica]|uniref:Glycosyltransferase family 4 protein n=1 Tax=Ferrimonas lipolytica TaxID=2724191 RepID=A0A6H1UGX2_9GAMM|nr:glycosyltransferase family 4 protein [Ferrimonas lipolytica]QIZ78355.1 glycosyltransferase family 4 protein [Ferrimonas lipolytica]